MNRLNIIYDFKIHNQTVPMLVSKYGVNYNTIRKILHNYNLFGRIRFKKYKRFDKQENADGYIENEAKLQEIKKFNIVDG